MGAEPGPRFGRGSALGTEACGRAVSRDSGRLLSGRPGFLRRLAAGGFCFVFLFAFLFLIGKNTVGFGNIVFFLGQDHFF